jgi:hypothetical protein
MNSEFYPQLRALRLLDELKQGDFVIVIRHGRTNRSTAVEAHSSGWLSRIDDFQIVVVRGITCEGSGHDERVLGNEPSRPDDGDRGGEDRLCATSEEPAGAEDRAHREHQKER